MNRPFVFIMSLVAAGVIGWMMIVLLPVLIIICMISIIGIPLGIALMALPTIYAYLVVAGAICWLLTPSWRSFVVGSAVALGIGIFVPAIINHDTNSQLDALVASQFVPEGKPANLPAVWVLEEAIDSRVSDRFLRCSNLCLYLLYNKSAPIVGSRLIVDGAPEAIKFYAIEKRASCEMPRFFRSAYDSTGLVDMERIKARITAGECLIERSTPPATYVLASFAASTDSMREAGNLIYSRLIVKQVEAEKETLLLNKVFYSGGMLAQPMYLNLEGGMMLKTWFVIARHYFVSDENGQPEPAESLRSLDRDKLNPVSLLQQRGFIE